MGAPTVARLMQLCAVFRNVFAQAFTDLRRGRSGLIVRDPTSAQPFDDGRGGLALTDAHRLQTVRAPRFSGRFPAFQFV